MKKLVFEIRQLCLSNRDRSYETQRKRLQILSLVATQLTKELGYNNMGVHSLKPKHIEALVNHWQTQDIATATLKQRMSQIRWWAAKINKQNVVARTNEAYGIGQREYSSLTSKAQDLSNEQIQHIDDVYVRASVRLEKAFGLRKEEAIKFSPSYADQGSYIQLKASWCKGGRERTIPILTQDQRKALDYATQVAGKGALIPDHLSFKQQKSRYEFHTRQAGLKKLHGLRHQYAQERYKVLTGWECSHRGGPMRQQLSDDDKVTDTYAREIISSELGHNRLQIVTNYIGR